jgi:hypothetical protein
MVNCPVYAIVRIVSISQRFLLRRINGRLTEEAQGQVGNRDSIFERMPHSK